MKNSKQFASKFASQVKKLKKQSAPLELADPVDVLVYSQLLWESSTSSADDAWARLEGARIDWHEIRVSTPDEIASMCGDSSPLALDRAARMKAMLNHLYQRHHDVTMEGESGLSKRDMKDSIESLDGVTPFVAARWLLLVGEIGMVPVDEQLCWMLANAGCVDESAGLHEVAAWVSRQIKADQAWMVHATLQAWVNGQSDRVAKARAKEQQAALRAAKKRRGDAQSARAKAQEIAREKKLEAARRAAARKAAAEQADAERLAAAEARKAARAAPAVKAPAKKQSTKKKAAKKPVAKKRPAKKSTAKKTTKKAAKKTPAKKSTTKKTAKKSATKKPARKTTAKKSRSRK